MKALKIFGAIIAAIIIAAPAHAAETPEPVVTEAIQALTSSNGSSAGLALLNLYTSYKSAGKLDLSNAANISSLITLASNIKGLGSQTKSSTKSFLSGLISGSKNLVNKKNSASVLSSLTSLANVDLSSLASTAASSAASKAASGLLSKMTGTASTAKSTASSAATSAASSILSSMFGKF